MATLLARTSQSADHPAVLDAIGETDCSLAIWERAPFADFAALVEGDPADLRFECTPADCAAMLAAGLQANGFGGEALHPALAADAAQLAERFCAALNLARLELRLEVVRTDSCRKWHADYVTARLITTYVGEGTDWLDESNADRVAAGQEPLNPQRLRTFDVGLFKGKLATERPAIHRSPPIAGTGAVRLLLVLNPASRLFVEGG
ncbi:DUF1826 domain-containing protein [Porphyrobacter sp. HT-58-2]|uniref:DUF1826 domain-containing protein n=1 Tax=Porphyrobacter sp. HT-58-2 TaxID=2023229 RepID=UPI001559340F|nr:DUF1826 domain-containing protein [Porphyrobacter sp. HT-58-2]